MHRRGANVRSGGHLHRLQLDRGGHLKTHGAMPSDTCFLLNDHGRDGSVRGHESNLASKALWNGLPGISRRTRLNSLG